MGRDLDLMSVQIGLPISIHAPRVGRDGKRGEAGRSGAISIHAPRVGRDAQTHPQLSLQSTFQSTRPVWGATGASRGSPCAGRHFNPRAPCGARQAGKRLKYIAVLISIHAPRVGRDRALRQQRAMTQAISIHAPRVGRDQERANLLRAKGVFQSTRPVWGATIVGDYSDKNGETFQSTRPVWGATKCG